MIELCSQNARSEFAGFFLYNLNAFHISHFLKCDIFLNNLDIKICLLHMSYITY